MKNRLCEWVFDIFVFMPMMILCFWNIIICPIFGTVYIAFSTAIIISLIINGIFWIYRRVKNFPDDTPDY